MDEKEGTRGTPTPPMPTPLNPVINPEGGIIVVVTTGDFPVIIAIDDNIPASPSLPEKASGNLLNVNSSNFPVEIRFKGGGHTGIGTVADVSRDKFPLTIKIVEGSSPAFIEESPQGYVLTVSTDKFPVQIKLQQ